MSTSASTSASDKRVILISGANKGIGYEAAKLLAQQLPSSAILLGTRSLDNGRQAVKKMQEGGNGHSFDNVRPIELDVTKQATIDAAVQQVKAEHGRLDVLLCNAGVAGSAGETPEQIFQVNIDGVHRLIDAFLPIIPAATGLIDVVSSEVGAWATAAMPASLHQTLTTPQSVSWPLIQQYQADWLASKHGEQHEQPWPADKPEVVAYTISKAFLSAYLRSFAQQHPQPKLVVTCPGYCATDLNRNQGYRPASKGGESVAWPILHQSEAEGGQFYQDGKVHPYSLEIPASFLEGFKKYHEMEEAQLKKQQQN